MRRQSSSGTSQVSPKMEMPASFTQVSNRPNSRIAAAATCLTSSSLPTSQTTATARPPCPLISSARSRSAASLRAASTTAAPCAAAIRAVTSPMPLLAPVMTITCSARGFRVGFIAAAPS